MLNYLSAVAANLLLWHRNVSADVSFLSLVHEGRTVHKIVRNSKPEIFLNYGAFILQMIMKLIRN